MTRPKLADLWSAFPTHDRYRTLGDLYRMLGGVAEQNIDAPGFGENGNGCASRSSVAFNNGGAPISRTIASRVGARTVGAKDGSRIIFAVNEFRAYLLAALGRPQIDGTSPYADAFRGKKGIIAFGVRGWDNASGHIALWNGRSFREPSYDDYSAFSNGTANTYRGELWELP